MTYNSLVKGVKIIVEVEDENYVLINGQRFESEEPLNIGTFGEVFIEGENIYFK